MRGSESRMNTAVHFVEHLNGFPAQGQEFFVRGQGHSSVPPSIVLFTSPFGTLMPQTGAFQGIYASDPMSALGHARCQADVRFTPESGHGPMQL